MLFCYCTYVGSGDFGDLFAFVAVAMAGGVIVAASICLGS
jgi:hypothetical protein